MKRVIKRALFGILLGSAIFAIIGVFFDIKYDGNYALVNWEYTKMLAGGMLVGMGFSLPSLIYDSNKLHYTVKVLLHLGIGCTVMLIVAFSVGWIPLEAGWKVCAISVGGYLLSAFLIWLACSYYFKKQADKINEKIKQIQRD